MAINVGSVAVSIVPDATKFWAEFKAKTRPEGSKVGDELGRDIGSRMSARVAEAVSDGLGKAAAGAVTKARSIGEEVGKAIGEPAAKRVKDGIGKGIDDGGRGAAAKGSKAGEEYGGYFGQTVRKRIEAALKALPDAKIDADSTDADLKIAAIRKELDDLRTKRIGVDVDESLALAQLDRMRGELDRLGAESPSVRVRADTLAASAQIAAIQAEVDKVAVDRPTIKVDADTAGATAQLAAVDAESGSAIGEVGILGTSIAALGPAIVPVAAAAAGALAAIGVGALAGAAGVGVMLLGFSGVSDAVGAIGDAQRSAGKDAASYAARQSQVAGAVDQVRSARAGLVNAEASAADAAVRAAEQERNADQTLAQAQVDAQRAQAALTQARVDAKQALEDLANQVSDGALAQRQANLDQIKAKNELDAVLTNPQSTELQRQQAQLTYDQAVQQVTDIGVRQGRLVAQKTAADKAGVDGSQQVQAAVLNIAQANDKVSKAQQGVADARRAQAAQERTSAYSIAQAQQAVVSAQRSLATAMATAGTEGSAAMTKLHDAMAALSPAGQKFARFIAEDLLPKFHTLKATAQAGLLPGVEGAIKALEPLFPSLNKFVGSVATTMGQLFTAAGRALTSPFWKQFFGYLSSIAGPTLLTMGKTIGALAQGFAGLLEAFAPVGTQLGGGFQRLAERFATWASTLGSNKSFQKFLDYVAANAPKVGQLIGGIVVAVVKLAIALAPLGALIVAGLIKFFDWLNKLTPGQFAALLGVIGAVTVAITLLVGGPFALVVAGLAAVVAGLIYAYQHFKTFREVVDVVASAWWAFAKTMARVYLWLWESVLKPGFTELVKVIKTVVAPTILWLWRNVFQPVFQAIGAVVSWAWNTVIKPAFAAIHFVVSKILGPIFLWLYEHVIKPAWGGIQVAISVAWAIIQVVFGLVQIAVKILAAVFTWLWKNVIGPVWDGIAAAIGVVWRTVLKPIFSALGDFIGKYVVPAFKTGVTAIGKAWDAVVDLAKKPVKFIVNTVLNDGLLAAYNWVAKKFHVKPDNVHIDLPSGFATGGAVYGAGTATSDSIPALLSNGEHVWTAEEVQKAGGHGVVEAMRRSVRGYAEGGGVGALLDPIGYISDKLAPLKALENSDLGRTVAAVPRRIVSSIVDHLKSLIGLGGGSQTGAGVPPTQTQLSAMGGLIQAAATQVGKPYVWAADDPTMGFDCSGLTKWAWLQTTGRNLPHSADAQFRMTGPPWPAPVAGDLVFFGGGQGHKHHVGIYAGNDMMLDAPHTGANVRFEHVWGEDHIFGRMPANAGAKLFDSGGYLPPGLTLAYNGTGHPEPVLTHQQMQDIRTSKDGSLTLRVHVDDGKVRGLVRVEVEEAHGALADALVYQS